jgi:diacylglycerol kinase
MIPNKKMTFRARLKSFRYAANGLVQVWRQEANARIHFVAAILVVVAGFVRHLCRWQWIAIILAIALVWITEAVNSCIEMLCDMYCRGQYHEQVKKIKDAGAAAVLIAAIASVAIGLVVFLQG